MRIILAFTLVACNSSGVGPLTASRYLKVQCVGLACEVAIQRPNGAESFV
jgi:hypothetical protein